MSWKLPTGFRRGRGRGRAQGQILVYFVIFLPILIGLAALVADVPLYLRERSRLQDVADAAALAAAMEVDPVALSQALGNVFVLCTSGLGCQYPVNAIQPYCDQIPDATCEVIWYDPAFNRSVGVRVSRAMPTFFARIVGIHEIAVRATAYAAMTDQY